MAPVTMRTPTRPTARVCLVTAGHMSTCPRMLKAADALHGAGFDVRVVSASHTPWAVEADKAIRATRPWRWDVVDYSRATARSRQVVTGARRRMADALTRSLGSARAPAPLFVRTGDILGAVVLALAALGVLACALRPRRRSAPLKPTSG